MDLANNMKMTSIGWLPCDWDVVAIKDVTSIVTGATPSTAVKEYWGGEIPWMSSGELNQKFVRSVVGRITQEGYNNCGTHMVPNHCVLIGLAGQGKTRGTAAYNTIPLCTNQSIASILPSASFDSLYLYYWIDSQYNYLRLLSAGDGGRGGLNKQLLLNLHVPQPSLAEQKRIADALFGIDQLIDSINESITKKRQIKDGLMQQLLTGKTRLPGFSGEWVERRLDSFEIVNGSMLKSSEYEIGNVPVIAGGQTPAGFHSKANRPANTITISGSGAYAGFVSFHPVPIFASDCSTINNPKNADIIYLYFCLLSKQKDIYKCQAGGAQPHVHAKDIKDITIMMPSSVEEQKAISVVLTKSDEEIKGLEAQRDKYALIKQGMMQELLTGKTRLI